MQFMGDWAKGEFTAAGMTPGKEYGCTVLSDHGMAYVMGGDVFAFPQLKDAGQIKAQQLLARVLLEPATQIEFAQKKGSIPVRLDVDTELARCLRAQGRRLGRGCEGAGPGKRDAVAAGADRCDRGHHLAILERPDDDAPTHSSPRSPARCRSSSDAAPRHADRLAPASACGAGAGVADRAGRLLRRDGLDGLDLVHQLADAAKFRIRRVCGSTAA